MNVENENERRLNDVQTVSQVVRWICKDAMRTAMKMRRVDGQLVQTEAWRCIGEITVELLTRLFNEIMESEMIPKEWRRSEYLQRVTPPVFVSLCVCLCVCVYVFSSK